MGGGPVNFTTHTIDFAIRRMDFPLPNSVSAAPLFQERIGPVCRPELIESLKVKSKDTVF
jgi:LysR family transcriptional regulator, glycine cleavage system transcriptional activator